MIHFASPSAVDPYVLPCTYTWEWPPGKTIKVFAVSDYDEYMLGSLSHSMGQNLPYSFDASALPKGKEYRLALRWEDGSPLSAECLRGIRSIDLPYNAELVCKIVSQISSGWSLIEFRLNGYIPPHSTRIRNNGEPYWHRLPEDLQNGQVSQIWFWSPQGTLPSVDTPGIRLNRGIRWDT